MLIIAVIFCLFSYLIGSIPTGYWIGLIVKRIDIRTVGSKNIGATNVFRILGRKYGILVLVMDILKGVIPVIAARIYFPCEFQVAWILIGMSAVCGHTWTIFLRFKGGKGVATSLGVFLGLAPVPVLIVIPVFAAIVYFTRFVSLGSIVSSLLLSPLVWIFTRSLPLSVFCIAMTTLIILRHIPNIKRLMKGEENKLF
ncbi:glycerol-3-phosphate 1-O-acyltransferase PlsY [bacterium]|nr:glycerol-3-phosphate 1-O-acyltransferase PlsY [bacterium]MBU1754017.1 glycerol-3-phosphate 1-O-acyltransferase PlsY [bacterium]